MRNFAMAGRAGTWKGDSADPSPMPPPPPPLHLYAKTTAVPVKGVVDARVSLAREKQSSRDSRQFPDDDNGCARHAPRVPPIYPISVQTAILKFGLCSLHTPLIILYCERRLTVSSFTAYTISNPAMPYILYL